MEASRTALVVDNLRMVRTIAFSVAAMVPRSNMNLDDLVSAGQQGLFEAANSFDAGLGVPFSSYAKLRIRWKMLDQLRFDDWVPRELRELHKRIARESHKLAGQFQRAPTSEEIAKAMGMSMDVLHALEVDWAQMQLPESLECCLRDFCLPKSQQPDSIAQRVELCGYITLVLSRLPKRWCRLLVLHYLQGLTLLEIAGLFGVHASRASQIHKSALHRAAILLHSIGIRSSADFITN